MLCALVITTMWRAISPKLHEFPTIEMAETVVQGVRTGRPSNTYNSRALRWVNIKQANNKVLSKVIDLEKILTSGHTRTLLVEFLRFSSLQIWTRYNINAQRGCTREGFLLA